MVALCLYVGSMLLPAAYVGTAPTARRRIASPRMQDLDERLAKLKAENARNRGLSKELADEAAAAPPAAAPDAAAPGDLDLSLPFEFTTRKVSPRSARFVAPISVAIAGLSGALLVSRQGDGGGPAGLSPPAADAGKRAASKQERTFFGGGATDALGEWFPTAVTPGDAEQRIAEALKARGYTKQNTLFGHSTCPDEANAAAAGLVSQLRDRWGPEFALGGLAGVPFAGRTGFEAFAHHAPDKGKLLILFAPHIGFDRSGTPGRLERAGRAESTASCGAISALLSGGLDARLEDAKYFDPQLKFLNSRLGARLKEARKAPSEIVYATYCVYELVRTLVINEVMSTAGFWSDADGATEVALVGGVMINRASGDRFQPLLFQRYTPSGETESLFEQAFGPPPDLSKALGTVEGDSRFAKRIVEERPEVLFKARGPGDGRTPFG